MYGKFSTDRIGKIFLRLGAIDEFQLDTALEAKNNGSNHLTLGEILKNLGHVTDDDITAALTVQYRFPYIPVSKYEISRCVITIVPEELVRKHNALPVERVGAVLSVAMTNPLNSQALEELKQHAQCSIQIMITSCDEMRLAIKRYFEWPQEFPHPPQD